MYKVGLATLVSGAGLYLGHDSPFYIGGPLHFRGSISTTRLARQYREHPMAGTIAAIYFSQESLFVRGICATYRTRPARTRWGKNDRSIAHAGEYFLGGVSAIGTCL